MVHIILLKVATMHETILSLKLKFVIPSQDHRDHHTVIRVYTDTDYSFWSVAVELWTVVLLQTDTFSVHYLIIFINYYIHYSTLGSRYLLISYNS